jgi:hypothetical protein
MNIAFAQAWQTPNRDGISQQQESATVMAPTISPSGGVYRGPLTVRFAASTPETLVRYTVDGSTPSATAGTIYTAPFTVSGKTRVRAVAYTKSAATSQVVSSVYCVFGPPLVKSVSPSRVMPSQPVTVSGSGFGPWSVGGAVWMGTTYAKVVSWSDKQIVVRPAVNTRSGGVRVRVAGVWSNMLPFAAVVASGSAAASANAQPRRLRPMTGSTLSIAPNQLNMVVGDIHGIQALNSSGQSVTGLMWSSSNSSVVSLSTDDPPVLTALSAGVATITAGGASAQVTAFADALPEGSVIWSNSGNGSGVYSAVPAVPSPEGIADAFAFQSDGTVQAITNDGLTAWSADVSQALSVVPDFQGGLAVLTYDDSSGSYSIYSLDGVTGTAYPAYSASSDSEIDTETLVVHPDGTIFAVERNSDTGDSFIAIDSATGVKQFSVALPVITDHVSVASYGVLIAGDGYTYLSAYYQRMDWSADPPMRPWLLRVDTTGAYANIDISGLNQDVAFSMMTNADQGILLSSIMFDQSTWTTTQHLSTISQANVSVATGPQLANPDGAIAPAFQTAGGTFVGTVPTDDYYSYMVAFDGGGNLLWAAQGNYQPQFATNDGGMVATNLDSGTVAVLDSTGAVQEQLTSLPEYGWTYSWTQQWYSPATGDLAALAVPILEWAPTYQPVAVGNPSGTPVSAANLGTLEGLPLWYSPAGKGRKKSSCKLGADKIDLDGAALRQYKSLKQSLLTFLQSKPASSSCVPGINFGQMATAVDRQLPFNGLLSNLSLYAAGEWNEKSTKLQTWPLFQQVPVCSNFFQSGRWSGTVATAQIQAPGTNAYYATQESALKNLQQSTILHESLHNWTGLDDEDLYAALTGGILKPGTKTVVIARALEQYGCVGAQ